MTDTIARLKAVRAELSSRQRERDRLEGQRDALLKSLKDEFGLDTVEAAEAEADRLDADLAKQEQALETGLADLEKQMAK